MVFNDLLAGKDEILNNSTITIVYCSVINDCCASIENVINYINFSIKWYYLFVITSFLNSVLVLK